jgi:hypothetical protein
VTDHCRQGIDKALKRAKLTPDVRAAILCVIEVLMNDYHYQREDERTDDQAMADDVAWAVDLDKLVAKLQKHIDRRGPRKTIGLDGQRRLTWGVGALLPVRRNAYDLQEPLRQVRRLARLFVTSQAMNRGRGRRVDSPRYFLECGIAVTLENAGVNLNATHGVFSSVLGCVHTDLQFRTRDALNQRAQKVKKLLPAYREYFEQADSRLVGWARRLPVQNSPKKSSNR